LEKEIIQGTTPGSRIRVRPKTTWIHNKIVDCVVVDRTVARNVEERHQRSKIVHGAANLDG